MLPVLGTTVAPEVAAPHAAALGKAFQLTNFLRDVDEDLARGRVYLPADELAVHGVDREVLLWCQHNGRTDPRVRRALVDQHAQARRVYREAQPGIAMLSPISRPCVQAALTLYSEILSCIEKLDFQIFGTRASVGKPRRVVVAARGLTGAWWARTGARRR
jgi:phytoene synthase